MGQTVISLSSAESKLSAGQKREPKECRQMQSRLTRNFCSESNVWTRWRCRRCYSDIRAGLQGKYRQAVAAKSGEWATGSPTSSGEEDRKARSLEAENKELRARIDALEEEGKSARRAEYPFWRRRGFGRWLGESLWKSKMR